MLSSAKLCSTELLLKKAQVASAQNKESLTEDLISMAELNLSRTNLELAEQLAWQVIDQEQSASRYASAELVRALLILGALFEVKEKFDFAEQFYRAAVQMLNQKVLCKPELNLEAVSKLSALLKLQNDKPAMLAPEPQINNASYPNYQMNTESNSADLPFVIAA